MLGELLKDFTGILDDFRPGPKTRTITVAKPFCSPARNIITGALQPYGVKIHSIRERTRTVMPRAWLRQQRIQVDDLEDVVGKPVPVATIAKVTVNEAAAGWAEYLLLRTGKLYVPGQYVNKRNADWAARHGGKMPPAWQDGKPWIEKSCSEGVKEWQAIQKATRGKK